MVRKQLGAAGEQLATRFLIRQGYQIIEQNWHCRHGELDIIARKEEMLVFIEVKTRRGQRAAAPLINITPKKRERLVKSAYAYLQANRLEETVWRIDAIAVTLVRNQQPVIEHVEDVLDW